jgi:anti-anti-sigma factor
MNSNLYQANDMVIPAPNGMTELVRGTDQRLVECISFLLHEQNVALDLSTVGRIDAAGVAALISLYGVARNAGHNFTVCNVSGHVREILSIVGLEHILVSHDVVRASHSAACFERPAA